MKLRYAALAITLATTSMATQAATYYVQLTGTVTSQANPGSDPNIAVGDKVVMSGRFTDDVVFDNGVNRYAAVYGLPTSGNYYWNVKLNGLTWKSQDEFLDGFPFDFDPADHPLSAPYFELLPGGGIGTPSGWLIPVDTNQVPTFDLKPGAIRSGDLLYGNSYETPGFDISWDLAGATFTEVPEPATWAMSLAGFGMIGFAARRRGKALRSITC